MPSLRIEEAVLQHWFNGSQTNSLLCGHISEDDGDWLRLVEDGHSVLIALNSLPQDSSAPIASCSPKIQADKSPLERHDGPFRNASCRGGVRVLRKLCFARGCRYFRSGSRGLRNRCFVSQACGHCRPRLWRQLYCQRALQVGGCNLP